MIRKIAVGMSGGVDSSVSALLLKRAGFQVIGVFMKNWDVIDETGVCSLDEDASIAKRVCDDFKIPFQEVNFVKEYWNDVFCSMIKDYQLGMTPNPDVLCNSCIKFNQFYNYVRNEIGCDAIATGHYATTSFGPLLQRFDKSKKVKLFLSRDYVKDQTLFLSQIPQAALSRTAFPVGDMQKSTVKKVAKEAGLDYVLRRKESMGICFVGKKNGNSRFRRFMGEYVDPRPGEVVDIDTGMVLGHHAGVHLFTPGQRLPVSPSNKPYYVISRDHRSKRILVGMGANHPSLFSQHLVTSKPHWIHSVPENLRGEGGSLNCYFRFLHGAPLTKCMVKSVEEESLEVEVVEPLRAITPGQYAVFYLEKECLGSARIIKCGIDLEGCDILKLRTESS